MQISVYLLWIVVILGFQPLNSLDIRHSTIRRFGGVTCMQDSTVVFMPPKKDSSPIFMPRWIIFAWLLNVFMSLRELNIDVNDWIPRKCGSFVILWIPNMRACHTYPTIGRILVVCPIYEKSTKLVQVREIYQMRQAQYDKKGSERASTFPSK